MRIGFTGTQQGMNETQQNALRVWLQGRKEKSTDPMNYFHHGLCIGADEQAHKIARGLGYLIMGHPPIQKTKQMPIIDGEFDFLHYPLEYLARNKAIVEATQELVATPFEQWEQLRSGTWSTVRYARKMKKPHTIIFQSGLIQEYNYVRTHG